MKTKINKMSGRIHPLMATAAVSVTLVSLIGAAAITGILPTSKATTSPVVTTNANGVQTALMAPGQVQPLSAAPIDQTVAQTNNPAAERAAPTHAPAKHRTAQHRTDGNYAQQRANTGYADQQLAADVCKSCGRVESVQPVQSAAETSGVGVGVGAVVGGLLGNQVGGGNGRTLATVAGAVGGGYAGNEVEKRTRSTTTYQVRVRMDDGEVRTFPQKSQNVWRAGDRVRIVNGVLTTRG